MSKLDDILEEAHKDARKRAAGYGLPLDIGKSKIKTLIYEEWLAAERSSESTEAAAHMFLERIKAL